MLVSVAMIEAALDMDDGLNVNTQRGKCICLYITYLDYFAYLSSYTHFIVSIIPRLQL